MAEVRKDRQPLSLVDEMCRDLECPICYEEKELRMLTCQHACCITCIGNLIEKAESGGISKPKCPFCETKLEKKAEDYGVCLWTERFRDNVQKLSDALDSRSCQIKDCTNQIVKYCNLCDRFICYMHDRDGPCEGRDDDHSCTDIDLLASECKETLELWKVSWRKKIDALEEKKAELIKEIRNSVNSLHLVGDVELCALAEEHLPRMTTAQFSLNQVLESICKEEQIFKTLEKDVFSCAGNDLELIIIVKGLDYFESNQKRSLGDFKEIIEGQCCFDVRASVSGDILVGVNGGILVLEKTTGHQIGFHELGHHIFAFDSFDGKLLLGVNNEERTETQLILTDNDFNKIKCWKTHKAAIDLAVVGGKVYLSKASSRGESDDIMVYDIKTCQPLPDIIRNGSTGGVSGVPPHSIIVSDLEYNKLEKYKVAENNRWTIIWSQKVVRPWVNDVDEDGITWIRSNINDCITLLSRKGAVLQEIKDPQITKLGKIYGISITGDHLWLSYETGLGYFKITKD